MAKGASSNIFAAGSQGQYTHYADAAARGNTTLNGLTPGNYVVSFDYVIGPAQTENTYWGMSAEVGFEYGFKDKIITEGSGHFSSNVPIDTSWISFFAISSGWAYFNSAETNAAISSISVVPVAGLVPEPHAYWMFAAGLALLAGLRRKATR